MSWFFALHATHPVAHAVGIVALVCAAGLALGGVRVRGIGLGSAGVLFAGILTGHFSKPVEPAMLAFIQDFGLILFVFPMGLQLGPGFFAAWREHGVRLNALALVGIALATVLAVLLGRLAGMDPAATVGLLAGATTNTPALAAAQQALASVIGATDERLALPALASAVAYPVAIVGHIVALLLLQWSFGIDPVREGEAIAAESRRTAEPLERRTLVVENANLTGVAIADIPGRVETGVTISRIRHADRPVQIALHATTLRAGDRLSVVGTCAMLDRFQRGVGSASSEDLAAAPGDVSSRRVVVTETAVLGKTIGDLELARFGVVVTRVARAGVEMSATPSLRLQFGDVLQLVGAADDVAKATPLLGDAPRRLDETQFIPFFLGIFAGIALGMLPIPVPGLPGPLRLGLAAGPLVVALAVSRVGHVRRLVWHVPATVNLAFREFGIALFLAAVGLAAGPRFFATVVGADGVTWVVVAFVLAVLPLLVVGAFARLVLGMSFPLLAGVLAGSVTNPSLLAFATGVARSDAPTAGYATVYPVTMLLRILVAQLLTLALCR